MGGEQKALNGWSKQDLEGTAAGGRGRLNHWMEEALQEAQRRGDFDDLPGKGQPMRLDDPDPFGGPEAQVYKYLKEAGFTPEWVDLRRAIAAEITWLREHPGHPERPSRIVEVNIQIDKHNRQVPNGLLALPKVPSDFARQR